jgi:predicted amino acid racemase
VFLEATQKYNPGLIEAGAGLHRRGQIPPNTYVIDLDAVAENTRRIAGAGRESGIRLFAMTKQFGRNPVICQVVAYCGIPEFVAVSVDEARRLWRAGLRVNHLGHLVSCSTYDLAEVVDHEPEFVTVYNLEQAARLSNAVLGRRHAPQRILLRLYDEEAFFHPGQHGGFALPDLDRSLVELRSMAGVRVAGVTAHPCLSYSYEDGTGGPTSNLTLILKAAEHLKALGVEDPEVNAPGVTCATTIPILGEQGATQGEPGSALTGSTPLHAFSDQPERPAMIYVTEVSHTFGDRAFVYGGGFYPRGHVGGALVGASAGDAKWRRLAAEPLPAEAIDYYGTLRQPAAAADRARVGDTVIYAFRTQIFVLLSMVAVVAGVSTGSPTMVGLFDARGEPVAGR